MHPIRADQVAGEVHQAALAEALVAEALVVLAAAALAAVEQADRGNMNLWKYFISLEIFHIIFCYGFRNFQIPLLYNGPYGRCNLFSILLWQQ